MADMDLGKISMRAEVDYKGYAKALEEMERGTVQSTGRIAGMFKSLAATAALAVGFAKSMGAARAFSKELANVKSIAWDLNMEKVRTEILNVSAALGDSAEIANAVYYAYSAGVRGTEKELVGFTETIAKLAKTVGAGVTPVMDAATTMINAYGLSVKDAGNLSDWFYQIVKSGKTTGPELAQSLGQIAATAASAGISMDELGAALATLTTTMPTNISVTSLASSIRAIVNPTADASKAAAQYGIELSQTALESKGLLGVMQEIYTKTGGRADVIGKMFPAESARAILSLAGTQVKTFGSIVMEFMNKSGAAAKGFEAILESDDTRWAGLATVVSKVGIELGTLISKVLTLNGALNGLYKWVIETDARWIGWTAKVIGVSAALVGVNKAVKAIGGINIGGGFNKLVMKGGEKSFAEQSEKGKVLATERANAIRNASNARRTMLEAQNAAREAKAVSDAESAKVAESLKTFTYNKAMGEKAATLKRQSDAAAASANTAAEAYHTSRMAATNANLVYRTHNRIVTAGTGVVGKLGNAVRGLWMTIAANPIGALLTVVGLATAGIMWMIESSNAKIDEMAEKAQKALDDANEAYEKGEKRRDNAKKAYEALLVYEQKTNLSQSELETVKKLAEEVGYGFDKWGISVDKVNGKIRLTQNSLHMLNARMGKEALDELNNRGVAAQENYSKARVKAINDGKFSDEDTINYYRKKNNIKAPVTPGLVGENRQFLSLFGEDLRTEMFDQSSDGKKLQAEIDKIQKLKALQTEINTLQAKQFANKGLDEKDTARLDMAQREFVALEAGITITEQVTKELEKQKDDAAKEREKALKTLDEYEEDLSKHRRDRYSQEIYDLQNQHQAYLETIKLMKTQLELEKVNEKDEGKKKVIESKINYLDKRAGKSTAEHHYQVKAVQYEKEKYEKEQEKQLGRMSLEDNQKRLQQELSSPDGSMSTANQKKMAEYTVGVQEVVIEDLNAERKKAMAAGDTAKILEIEALLTAEYQKQIDAKRELAKLDTELALEGAVKVKDIETAKYIELEMEADADNIRTHAEKLGLLKQQLKVRKAEADIARKTAEEKAKLTKDENVIKASKELIEARKGGDKEKIQEAESKLNSTLRNSDDPAMRSLYEAWLKSLAPVREAEKKVMELQTQKSATESYSGFDALAAAMKGGDSYAQKTAKNTEEMVRYIKRMERKAPPVLRYGP